MYIPYADESKQPYHHLVCYAIACNTRPINQFERQKRDRFFAREIRHENGKSYVAPRVSTTNWRCGFENRARFHTQDTWGQSIARKLEASSMKKSPPTKGKGTPKGKGTLFSFFSKAPSSSCKSTGTPIKPKTAQDASGSNNTVTTPRTAEASPEQSSADSEEFVGKRIRVFWKDDGRWFLGKVVDYSLGKHTILYDDGDKEKVVLKNEKVRRGCTELRMSTERMRITRLIK